MSFIKRYLLLLITVGLLTLPSIAQEDKPDKAGTEKAEPEKPTGLLGEQWLKPFTWRSIGPANMGGRIVALAVHPKDPTKWWAATASGGLLKTTNNGTTFEHQFDKEKTVSIGDVAVSTSDANIVWVGTGENNPRNSVSYGDGVYKSTDGGKTWTHMGLKETFQIGRIAIHPIDPDIVYIGALGRLYGPNEERGLFKTTDGGKTWKKIWYRDENTGVIELQMNPKNPDELLMATWNRQRDGFDTNDPARRWGEGTAMYKTSDGGKTWKQITEGLPTCKLGRIGIDYYQNNPKIVYAVVDSEEIGKAPKNVVVSNAYMGITGQDGPNGARLTRVTPNGPTEKAGLQVNDVIYEVDKKPIKNYADLIAQIRAHKAGDKVKVKYRRANKEMVAELTYGKRQNRAGSRPFTGMLGGQRENIQNRQGNKGFQYGGIFRSEDGGDTWKRVNSLNPRPMYFSQIRVDPTNDKIIYVAGIALHRSIDGGKTFRSDGGRGTHPDHHALWIDPRDGRHMILGNDGGIYQTYDRGRVWDHLNTMAIGQFYHVAVSPRPHYHVYGGLQDNGSWGGPAFTRTSTGPINEDWIRIGGGDGFVCRVDPADPDQIYGSSQNGNLFRRNLRTGESRSLRGQLPRGQRYRFNWKTPYILSHHNSRIYYCAGNRVFRSLNKGDNLQVISPEIPRTNRGSATALAESPRKPGVLYVGTDDGNLWVTTDGGQNWDNVTQNVGLQGPRWVNCIEASRYKDGRAYVVFDGHRSNDDSPHVYVTENYGKTWKSLNANLPEWGTTRILREDITREDILYLGTEFNFYVSFNRGQSWNKLNNNLPTVAIHEIAQHPTSNELVVATHGRSIWILDVSALRQLSLAKLEQEAVLYQPKQVIRWQPKPSRGRTTRRFTGQNPSSSAAIYYSLPKDAMQVTLSVFDVDGKKVTDIPRLSKGEGLHRATWSLRYPRRRGQRNAGRVVSQGVYRVVLSINGEEQSTRLTVAPDPTVPAVIQSEQARQGVQLPLFDEEEEENEEEADDQ